MKKNHSTEEKLVCIPCPISPNGKVDIKNMKLPSLITSKNFSVEEITQEVSRRHPEKSFNSLLEWTEAIELALRLYPKEEIFSYQQEKEIIIVILKLTPNIPSDLAIFKQILENDWLSRGIKAAAQEQFEKFTR